MMKILNNMKVGAKIVVLSTVLLLCLAIVSTNGVLQLREIDSEVDTMYSNNFMALRWTQEANTQLINMSRAIRNIALVGEEARPNYMRAYDGFVGNIREELKKAGELFLVPAALELHKKTSQAVEELIVKNKGILDNIAGMTPQEAVPLLVAVRPFENAADNMMTELSDMAASAAEARSALVSANAEFGTLLSLGISALALLIGLALSFMIKKAIANPLVSIADKATLVASGDLSQDFSLTRRDELGDLAGALAKMVENLRQRIGEAEQKSIEAEEQSNKAQAAMVDAQAAKEKAEAGQQAILTAAEQIEQVVNRLSAATEELSAQIEQSSRGTDMQRDRVAQSATAMEEMNSTVMEVARNASIAADGSGRAREKADQGAGIVQESVSAINTVQTDTRELHRNMEELGQQAESIGTIMTVISDIADQTNLLALNAAIEAARAGEAGRGFAVVADEVRKLAEKTMEATKQVGDAIKGIQTGTRQSITAVERTTGNLDTTTDLVQRSGVALAEIVEEVSSTAGQVSSIATAAEEQSAASEEITSSLDEINRMASENAAAMQQSAQAVSELAQQAQELQTLVNNLRR
ncbi:methyl-accepting chemotaxis protein [Desulfovibrio sp. OttesenSCG-928-I05]|nr:methyl-accepting chemotaxis protein [Desulfovibrio sp. OttesenSCG-928-I05]